MKSPHPDRAQTAHILGLPTAPTMTMGVCSNLFGREGDGYMDYGTLSLSGLNSSGFLDRMRNFLYLFFCIFKGISGKFLFYRGMIF